MAESVYSLNEFYLPRILKQRKKDMTDPKNILYHFRVRGTGAEGVHIAGIVNGFRSLGYTVHLVSPTNIDPTIQSSKSHDPMNRNKSIISSVLHYLADTVPQPVFELMELAYNVFAIPKLIRNILMKKPDLIYERYAFFNFSGALVSRLMGKRLIVEVNEISGHERVRGQSLKWLASFIERYIFRQATMIITVSDFLNSEISTMIDSNYKIVTIPNGVPCQWFSSKMDHGKAEKLRLENNLYGKKVICFIGSLVQWHNFDLMFDAVFSIRRDIPEILLMIVGDGPLREHLRDKIQKLPSGNDSVLMIGSVPHHEIPLYIHLTDVAIIPETNSYRSPIKMFEYMALAKPVIAPRMPAIQVAIDDGKDGVLFEQGNLEDMKAALIQVLTDPERALELGIRARDKIMSRFTWEKHAENIINIFNTIDGK